MSIRLVIADDDPIALAGYKKMLADTDIQIVGQAKTSEEAMELAASKKPNVVLLDTWMPQAGGLYALGRIKLDQPYLPVLIISEIDNPTVFARAVALGACGYLIKSVTRMQLVTAIETAVHGEVLYALRDIRTITGAMATPRPGVTLDMPLTNREIDVLGHLVDGSTNKQIASKLKISSDTVKEHVRHILVKLCVADRTQAALWAVRKGLV